MKKILAFAVMAIMTLGASAQGWFAGGSLGLWRNATDNETTFRIAPELGYNLNNKWAVAGEISYTYKYAGDVKSNVFSINPYARYTYFTTGPVNFFLDGGVGLGFGSSKLNGHKSDTVAIYEIGFKPGIAVNVSKKVSLVAHFGFLGYRGTNNAGKLAGYTECGGFDFSGDNLTFGFYYNF